MVRLWLVRHGETDWNADQRFQSWTDVPLNDTGRRQATRLVPALEGRRFAGVWSSDLRRAVETAEILCGGAVPDPRLREMDLGDLDGKRWDELDPQIQAGLRAFHGFVAPGGESFDQFQDRVLAFLDDLGAGHHLVVTHGGVIRLLLVLYGIEDRFVGPGSLVTVDVPDVRP